MLSRSRGQFEDLKIWKFGNGSGLATPGGLTTSTRGYCISKFPNIQIFKLECFDMRARNVFFVVC